MVRTCMGFLLLIFSISSSAVASDLPNIVLIMADDLGLGDVSHHVRTQLKKEPVVETPAIDALARQSLWFTDGHSPTSLCSPTRYCMMSGNNNYRSYAPWGVWGTFRQSPFKPGEATLGSVVQQAGYKTGFIGKWHLGGDFLNRDTGKAYRGTDDGDIGNTVDLTKMVGGGPLQCGFDYDFTLPCGIQGPIYTVYENGAWFPLATDSRIVYLNKDNARHPKDLSSKGPGMGDSAWEAKDIGKRLSQKAVDFIDANANQESPFFLYYCSPMVHVPHCPPEEFDGKPIQGQTPSAHLDMILDFDQQVNRIVRALKAKNIFDDTLLVLVSDNGGLRVNQRSAQAGHDSSGGFAGSKNSPLEGGHRTPFFAVWKKRIQPGTTHEPALGQDLLATFAALVGTRIPADQAQDSNNLLPLLTGEGKFTRRQFIVQQAGSKHEVMYRKDDWKLIIQSDHKLSKFEPKALYNLNESQIENPENNLIQQSGFQSRVDQMLSEYLDVRQSLRRTAPVSD